MSSQSKSVAKSGWCNDELKFNTFSYEWSIKDFRCRTKKMKSSTFTVGDDQCTKWRLEVTPVHRKNDIEHVQIMLGVAAYSSARASERAKFKLSIVGQNFNEEIFELGELLTFSPRNSTRGGMTERDELLHEGNGLLLNDTLTVVCELHVLTDTAVTCGELSPGNMDESLLNLSKDFAQLLSNEDLSDCTLSVQGREFKVHRNILAARSPVFAAMFKHGMKEAEGEHIDIGDIEPTVMQQMIKYIYTGNAPKLGEMPMQLLGAADKYQLDHLKRICVEAAMNGSITPSNACEMLVVSHLHSANQLKIEAIQCINENADRVVESEGWNQMVKNYPQLVTEVFKAKKNSNK